MTTNKKTIECINYIQKNFESNEYENLFIELMNEFKHKLGFKTATLMMLTVINTYKDLEGDFRLLLKASSENFTINREHTQKELDKTRDGGIGYLEQQSLKNIFIAGTRFGKDDFPEYMPSTGKHLPKKITRVDIEKAQETKDFLITEE